MSTKNKPEMKEKSSKKVANFLEKNNLHKKDFAQMIGVTLSYIYNLIDETIAFSSRSTTLERIATVMDILPEEFDEYIIEQEPSSYNKNLEFIKEKIKENKMTTLDYIKMFERKHRLMIVDVLRGSKPLPINYGELKKMCLFLNVKNEDVFKIWMDRMVEYLNSGGFSSKNNEELTNAMFDCAKKYLLNA